MQNAAHSFPTSFADNTQLMREVKGVQDASLLQTDQWWLQNKKFEALWNSSDDTLKICIILIGYTAPDGTIITESLI